ncbi:hypothetical protein BH24ACT15_BH24ACT15_08350 [soil metagenome]
MNFFDHPIARPPQPEQPPMPPWMGPPDDQVGVLVPFIPTVARGADVAVVLAGLTAYPDGVIVAIHVRAREPRPRLFDVLHGHHGEEPSPGGLRFGFDLGEQGRVTNMGLDPRMMDDRGPHDPPPGPVLASSGGGGSDRAVDHTSWLWPLPTGPLTFVVQWQDEGIEQQRIPLDADAVRAAADAIQLW